MKQGMTIITLGMTVMSQGMTFVKERDIDHDAGYEVWDARNDDEGLTFMLQRMTMVSEN